MTLCKLFGILAIIAIVLSGFCLLAVESSKQQEQLAGITYDPSVQPSVLPLKQITASSANPGSGILIDYQKVNDSYIGEVVYLTGSTGYWAAANPTSSATTAGKLGMVVKKATTNGTADAQIMLMGVVYNSSWSLTKGSMYYISGTTPGAITASAPVANPQAIGWAANTSVIYFNPIVNLTVNGL